MTTPAKSTYLIIGDLQVELLGGVKGIKFKESNHYVEHPRIDKHPQLQWLGKELEAIDLSFRIHSGHADPEVELGKLRKALKEKEPKSFTFGSGIYNGDYVIVDLSTTINKTNAEGRLVFIECEATIKGTTEPSKSASKAVGLLSLASPFLRRF